MRAMESKLPDIGTPCKTPLPGRRRRVWLAKDDSTPEEAAQPLCHH